MVGAYVTTHQYGGSLCASSKTVKNFEK